MLIIAVLVFIIVVMKSGNKETKTAADEEALAPCSKHVGCCVHLFISQEPLLGGVRVSDCGNAMQATVQLQSICVEGMMVHQNELADHAQVRCTIVP